MLKQPKPKEQVLGQTQRSQEAEGVLFSREEHVGLWTTTRTCCSCFPIAGPILGKPSDNCSMLACWLVVLRTPLLSPWPGNKGQYQAAWNSLCGSVPWYSYITIRAEEVAPRLGYSCCNGTRGSRQKIPQFHAIKSTQCLVLCTLGPWDFSFFISWCHLLRCC